MSRTHISQDKEFLTYNQQMKRLRSVKKIECAGTPDKTILVRSGYFNLINGYKMPFTCGSDDKGNHVYIPHTDIGQLYALKSFDDELRSLLLKYITKVEEEVRTLVGYKFDQTNDNGKTPWYDTEAYDNEVKFQYRMSTISKAYQEISRSHLDYIRFYMSHHSHIPTWIMLKAVNFSTFIDVLDNSKKEVKHSICKLYSLYETDGHYNVKLLIGSMHWMRRIRNACAHNERIYCLELNNDNRHQGRILEKYISELRPAYARHRKQCLFDLFVYMKYYLPSGEFMEFIEKLKSFLFNLKSKIHPQAFENVRAKMGIVGLSDLDQLVSLPKNDIEYNKFDQL